MTSSETVAGGSPVDAPLGTRHLVSDGRMLLHQFGIPATPVVWLAGGGMFGLYYKNLHQLVAEFTTSVIYDQGVAGADRGQRLVQARTLAGGAGQPVVEIDPFGLAPEAEQRLALHGEVLLVGRAARVTTRTPDTRRTATD